MDFLAIVFKQRDLVCFAYHISCVMGGGLFGDGLCCTVLKATEDIFVCNAWLSDKDEMFYYIIQFYPTNYLIRLTLTLLSMGYLLIISIVIMYC